MPAKLLFLTVALAMFAGSAAGQPDPKPLDDRKLVTKVYNIKPLLGERGKGVGIAGEDGIAKMILETISLGEPKPGADGPQLIQRDGGKLEVRATAKVQEEIKDLLDALDRLADIAIDVKADVYELDPAAYEKLVKAIPKGKTKAPVLFATGEEIEGKEGPATDKAMEEMNKILKTGRVVQTSTGRVANGQEATVSARRAVVPFTNFADQKAGIARDNPLFVKEGFALVAVPVVSADRRFVRFKLTEQSTRISGIKKRDFGEIGGKPVLAQSLEVEDLGATGSAEVADGGTAIFRLAYAPKDKVWVVVLKPTIFIQAEEDELKKEEKRLEDKVKRVLPSHDLVKPIKQ